MIEPIAEVFNVSILEIMRSEKMSEQPIPMESAAEAINNVIDAVAYQRKIERRYTVFLVAGYIGIGLFALYHCALFLLCS